MESKDSTARAINLAKTTKDMTQGTPWKLISAFALPTLLSQIFQQLYNTADTLIVGRTLGTDALAAVSASGTLIFLMISFFVGTTMGAGITISRYFGAKDYEMVSKAVHTNVVIGFISGVLLTVVGMIFTPTFLRWMNTDPEFMDEAVQYFRFYFAGGVASIMYNTFKSIMNALGDSKRPLYYLIFSSVLNVLLDLLFIAVFRWGVWSAAVATVISQAASCVLCLIQLCKKGTVYQLKMSRMKIDVPIFKEIIRYGLPAGIQNSVIAIANVIVQGNINSFKKIATAAYGTYAKIEGFAFLPINSFTMAITTFVGQNLGAGEYERARRGSRFGIITAVLMAEAIGLVIWLFAPAFIRFFVNDKPDIVEKVVQLGTDQARIEAFFYCLLAFSHSVAAVCRGAGKAFVPMLVMLGVWCLLRIAYIETVMHMFNDIHFIYWAYPLTWGISSCIFLFYYLFSDWIHGFETGRLREAERRRF